MQSTKPWKTLYDNRTKVYVPQVVARISVLIFFVYFIYGYIYQRLLLSHYAQSPGQPQFNSELCSTNVALMYQLSNEHPNFHSNHWFHLGEYYLSRMFQMSFKDVNNIMKTQIMMKSNVMIISANSPRFLEHITPMSIFLLRLAFDSNNVAERFHIIYPSQPTVVYNNSGIASVIFHWNSQYKQYKYNNDSDYSKQYSVIYPSVKAVKPSVCVLSRGVVGQYPIPTDRWFKSIEEVDHLRRLIRSFCPESRFPLSLQQDHVFRWKNNSYQPRTQISLCSSNCQSKFKLVVYQRDQNRRFLHLENLLNSLASVMSDDWNIEVIRHDESIHPCLFYDILRDTDMLLTTHGFQSIGVIFMKPGAVLYEIFPYKYFKSTYLNLTKQLGIHHRMILNQQPNSWSRRPLMHVSTESCMQNWRCRSYARKDDVTMTNEHINQVIQTAKAIEIGKIGQYNGVYEFI